MLAAPTSLTAIAKPPSDLCQLRWPAVPGAYTYNIYLDGHFVATGSPYPNHAGTHSLRLARNTGCNYSVAAVDSFGNEGARSAEVRYVRPLFELGRIRYALVLITFPGLPAPTMMPETAGARLSVWAARLSGLALDPPGCDVNVYGWLDAPRPVDWPEYLGPNGNYNATLGLWYGSNYPKIRPVGVTADVWVFVYHGVGVYGNSGGGDIQLGETTGFGDLSGISFDHELGHAWGGALHCGDLMVSNQDMTLTGPVDLGDLSAQRVSGASQFCRMGVPLNPAVGFCPYHAQAIGLRAPSRTVPLGEYPVMDEIRFRPPGAPRGAFYSVARFGASKLIVRYHPPAWSKPSGATYPDIVACGGPLAVGHSWKDTRIRVTHTKAGWARYDAV